ncbi:MAG: PAAR domain-containing protein [Porphyrobacter sp.]|nr:PAAR domain-containing protein [Porphyrobacter sp.]
MPPAARITDMHTCPMVNPGPVPHVGGPVVKGQPNVLTCMMPQARVSDQCVCAGPPDVIAKGSATVLVGGQAAARIGDQTAHGGAIVSGAPTVLIGDGGNGGGGGGGAGMGMSFPLPLTAPNLQTKAMIGSHKAGKSFVPVCQK